MLKLRLVIRRVLLVLAACVWISSVVGAVHATGGRQQPQAAPTGDALQLASGRGSLLRELSQRAREDCRHRARRDGRRRGRAEFCRVGEGRAEAPERHDAPAGAAATGAGGVRRPRRMARDDAGSRRARRAECRPTAGPSPQPGGVRERDSRSAGLGRRSGDAAAPRRFELRLRQHRRRARHVARAARKLSDGGRQDQRARGGQPGDWPELADLSRARGRLAGGARRRPAARHARRPRSSIPRSRSTASTSSR